MWYPCARLSGACLALDVECPRRGQKRSSAARAAYGRGQCSGSAVDGAEGLSGSVAPAATDAQPTLSESTPIHLSPSAISLEGQPDKEIVCRHRPGPRRAPPASKARYSGRQVSQPIRRGSPSWPARERARAGRGGRPERVPPRPAFSPLRRGRVSRSPENRVVAGGGVVADPSRSPGRLAVAVTGGGDNTASPPSPRRGEGPATRASPEGRPPRPGAPRPAPPAARPPDIDEAAVGGRGRGQTCASQPARRRSLEASSRRAPPAASLPSQRAAPI